MSKSSWRSGGRVSLGLLRSLDAWGLCCVLEPSCEFPLLYKFLCLGCDSLFPAAGEGPRTFYLFIFRVVCNMDSSAFWQKQTAQTPLGWSTGLRGKKRQTAAQYRKCASNPGLGPGLLEWLASGSSKREISGVQERNWASLEELILLVCSVPTPSFLFCHRNQKII